MDTLFVIVSVVLGAAVALGLLLLGGADAAVALILKYTLEPFVGWFMRVFHGIDKPVAGPETLIGSIGHAISDFVPAEESSSFHGRIRIGAESWSAQSTTPVTSGKTVRVIERQGISLHVESTQ